MLLSALASFSSHPIFILLLALCLLGITTTARPIDQIDTISPALSDKITDELVLHEYLLHGVPVEGRVSLGIGSETIRPRYMKLSKEYQIRKTKIGHVHFENEKVKKAILKLALATYLDHRDVIDEATLKNWNDLRPDWIVANTGQSVISLIVYRTAPKKSAPRTTGLVSLKIGKEIISPQRSEQSILLGLGKTEIYATVGKIQNSFTIDLHALHEHATSEHLRFLVTTPEESDWRSRTEVTEQGWVEQEVGKKYGLSRRDPFRNWLFSDGCIEGLWEQQAIDSESLSTWIDLRYRYDSFHSHRQLALLLANLQNHLFINYLIEQSVMSSMANHFSFFPRYTVYSLLYLKLCASSLLTSLKLGSRR
ncbi:hypothetical protein F5878DRAFT_641141 [Lentinula raphanica]|uniref:Uncharacterized protein n=1 Tax=Lentinula raphanica TaxID=153919 RepID=A0AA38PAS6_9AGAR|nr:hypothetical protein F5880DRAFT_1510398 [Lentinula raphanica]KAJ3839479.1 hypothetical protein F5878DRAFT_641141 [Lentinula raphanica]